MTGEPYIEVRNLTRVFDVSKPWPGYLLEGRRHLKAVDEVTFSVRKGETFALVGESGSGKTTLARMLAGLLPPTGGEILYEGISMTSPRVAEGRKAVRPRMQMIFQDPFASLNPRWRAGKIIAEPIRALGLVRDRNEIRRRVVDCLDRVGLHADDAYKYAHEFSGGQRQRIAIARVLAAEADFVICDEPTSALDVSVQAQILNLMRDLQDSLGWTYLFISHHLAVVRYMAARVGVMYFGRLVEVAETELLFSMPKHPYTRMLLDAVPDLSMSKGERTFAQGEPADPINPPAGCAFHPRCPLADGRCRQETPLLIDGIACHAVSDKWVSWPD